MSHQQSRLPAVPSRILYIANSDKIGGGGRVLMDLMLNLDPKRYRPILVAPQAGAMTDWAERSGIKHHVCRAGDWLGAPALARRTASLLHIILRERAAIVHTASPTCYRAAGVAGRLARAARVCHLGFPPMPGEFRRSFVSAPEAVIGCYEGQAREHEEEIKRLRADCRVVGICNGIDTSRFIPDDADVSVRRGAPQVIGILGHISEVKGHPEFVEAAALITQHLPHARFVIIGGETLERGLRATLEQRAQDLGIRGQIDFLGFRNDVARVLAATDLIVLPSHAEGFPLAVLEAMACGKPVVATPVGGVSEAVIEGITGTLIPPGRADALATAVLNLLQNPDLMLRMGQAARERAEQRFSVERFARAVQNLYAQVEGKASSPRTLAA